MNNQKRTLLFSLPCFSLSFFMVFMQTHTAQSITEKPFYRKLGLIPVKAESFGLNAKVVSKVFIKHLQQVATFLHFQNRLMFRLASMKKKSISKISESRTLKKSAGQFPEILRHYCGENEELVKAYTLCKYLDLKLTRIAIPEMGKLAPYNVIEPLKHHVKQAMALTASRPTPQKFIDQGTHFYTKLCEMVEFYRSPEIRIAFDNQYTEIVRVLRRSIDFAARCRKPIDYSDHLLDLYFPNEQDPDYYELIDSLLTEQARAQIIDQLEEDADDFTEDDESIEDTQTTSVNAAPAPVPSAPPIQPQASTTTQPKLQQQPEHGVPNQYSVKHASEKVNQQTVAINDIDNGLMITLDLSEQPASITATTSETPTNYYSKEIKEWFSDAYNQLKKRGQHQIKLPKRQWIIQQNRFCPLIDCYIRALGRKYLEITNPHPEPKKPQTFTTCLDQYGESLNQTPLPEVRWGKLAEQFGINHRALTQWMSDAERRKHKARIRIDMDGQITLKNGKSFPGTFVYHIDPYTEQIGLRTIECDYKP